MIGPLARLYAAPPAWRRPQPAWHQLYTLWSGRSLLQPNIVCSATVLRHRSGVWWIVAHTLPLALCAPKPQAKAAAPATNTTAFLAYPHTPAVNGCVNACCPVQLAKPLVHWHTGKGPLDWLLALSPGGMPSSHTASVVGMTTALGLLEGTSSNMFALALVLTLIVAYDATGVRLHAGAWPLSCSGNRQQDAVCGWHLCRAAGHCTICCQT